MKPIASFGSRIIRLPGETGPIDKFRAFAITVPGELPADLEFDHKMSHADLITIVWYADGELSRSRCDQIVDALKAISMSHFLVSFLGLKVDLAHLAAATGRVSECRAIAAKHCDIAFQLLSFKGWYPSLNVLLEGSGLGAAVTNDTSPLGGIADMADIVNGLADRTEKLLNLGHQLHDRLSLRWAGPRKQHAYFHLEGCQTVSKCLIQPAPDTSWMKHIAPETRNSHIRWAQQAVLG